MCLANAKRPCDCSVLCLAYVQVHCAVVRILFQTWRHSALVTKVVTVCAQCSECQPEEIQKSAHSVTAVWPIPNCTACHWPQRHTGTSSLFKATKRWCPARTRTRYPQVWCPTDSDTMPGLHDTSQINAKKTWELGIFPCLVNVQFCSCCNGYLSASISEC